MSLLILDKENAALEIVEKNKRGLTTILIVDKETESVNQINLNPSDIMKIIEYLQKQIG